MISSARLFFFAFLVTAIIGAAVSLALGDSGSDPAADPQLTDEFSILSTPPEGTTKVSASEADQYGVDENQAQSGAGEAGTVDVAAGDDGLCVNTSGALTCASPSSALDGKVGVAEVCGPSVSPGSVKVSGVVPDGINAVVVVLADGDRVSTPSADNVYSVEVPGAPSRVEDSQGGLLTDLPARELDPASC